MNIFSFFSGAGFLDLGFEMTNGYNVVYVSEFYKTFNDIYQYSRAHMQLPEPRYGHHIEDITKLLEPTELERLRALVEECRAEDLTGFIGGPPCPDFSIAGSNKGKDGENGKLSGTYTELIAALRPDFFLFENVKGLYRTKRHREFFEQLKQTFRDNGYFLTEQLINALEYGAPQDRERIILIGIHSDVVNRLGIAHQNGELIGFPWEAHKRYTMNQVLACQWPTQTPYNQGVPTPIPEGIIPELTVQYWWNQNDVEHHPNHNMFFQPRAGLHRFMTKDEGDVERKCYKRLHRHRYSPTAAYGNNEVHVHPFLPRRISVSEALAIQSLPPTFEIPVNVTLSDAFKTIGNGVPFVAARGVAESLLDYLTR